MINNYSEIVTYNEGEDYFDEFLQKIHLIDIFKSLISVYPNKKEFTAVVKFIMYGFSLESEMLTTSGLTWDKIAERIFNKVGLDKKHYNDVALLEKDEVRECSLKWLRLQNDENFSQFCAYRGLRQQFLSVVSLQMPKIEVKDENGDKHIDLDAYSKIKSIVEAKMTAVENAKDLLQMMQDSKAAFIQNHAKLKTSVGALSNVSVKKNTTSVEDFLNG